MKKNNENIKLITSCSDCSIRVFRRATYFDDYKGLIISGKPTKEQLHEARVRLYVEFADISGLSQSEELELSKKILYLDLRIKRNQLLLHVQYESLEKIGMPCIGAFKMMQGYKFSWDKDHPDVEGFKKQLDAFVSRERKYEMELQNAMKEFYEKKKKKANNELTSVQKHRDFIKQIINLEKMGFHIDNDKTSAEELALMIAETNSQLERDIASSSQKN